jgi:surface antigen
MHLTGMNFEPFAKKRNIICGKSVSLLAICIGLTVSGCQTFQVTPAKDQRSGDLNAGISGGGLVGGPFGNGLTLENRQLGLNAEYKALEYGSGGELVAWTGKDGTSGSVVAAQPYRVGSQDCRQYKHELTALGKTSSSRATACRNSDGSWTLLN